MTANGPDLPADRKSPVGTPVVRGDETIAGDQATDAVRFDPDDPESLERATTVVREFASESTDDTGQLYVLRGAAACAALVRGTGSYKQAAKRAGNGVTVSFIRKWARVHDLPRAVRINVAVGNIAPTAAKHIARVEGPVRYDLTWATLEHNLPVRTVRKMATKLNNGADPDAVFAAHGVKLGRVELDLPRPTYRELRRQVALSEESLETAIARAIGVSSADD